MKKIILTVLFFSLFYTFDFAQGVTVSESSNISGMMEKFVEINKNTRYLEGWRIQVLATTDRGKIENEKQKFKSLFPHIPVTWEHSKPYFRLKAGAFKTKLEAIQMLYIIKRDYPSAYATHEKNIRPEELL